LVTLKTRALLRNPDVGITIHNLKAYKSHIR